MFCSSIVLPALGGDTMRPRCPFPIGAARSMIRAVRSSVLPLPCSRVKRDWGKSGVRFSKRILLRAFSGRSRLSWSTLSSAKYRSPSFGGRILPDTVSPVRSPNRRIWLGET